MDFSGYRVCSSCGAKKGDAHYFSAPSEDSFLNSVCKSCVYKSIDVRDEATVIPLIEELDLPWVPKIWVETVNKVVESGKKDAKSVLGRYTRTMNLGQYKEFGYKDSKEVADEYDARHPWDVELRWFADEEETQVEDATAPEKQPQVDVEAFMEQVMDKLDAMKPKKKQKQEPAEEPAVQPTTAMNSNEVQLLESLSDSDVAYLTAKWGSEYLPSEWVQMEDLYRQYEAEYEMNIDRRQTLVMICKTTVKMNQALSDGNVADYQKLASVLKDLRTSGKFTEAQKVEKTRYIDSIGELVAFCEREGGIIPRFKDPDDYPEDLVDFTIKDMKSYTYNLVANEMGLGAIIETYIKKLEEADKDMDFNLDSFITSNEEADEEFLNDVTALEWQQYLESGIEDDIEEVLRQVKS